jgi:uncharacterized membrane protein YciS (DUF1049 family)
MRLIKTFILLIVLIVIALFFLQNNTQFEQEVVFQLKFYIWDYIWNSGPVPLFFVVLLVFALGMLITMVMLGLDRFKLSYTIRRANKKIRKLEKELQGLRELPLATRPAQSDGQPPADA